MNIKAKAKVNFFLSIYGKRVNDGYHLIDSLVAFTDDIYDEISLEIADANKLTIHGEFASHIDSENNIIAKVLNKLAKKYKYHIILNKNIPVSAGLGGGSSDAALVIKHILLMENSNLPATDIEKLCLAFGADVPICYRQQVSYFSGIGEIIEDIRQFPKLWAVIVNPRIELATSSVFNNFSGKFSSQLVDKKHDFSSQDELISFLKEQTNDLTNSASQLVPEISQVLGQLAQTKNCLLARMTGSGATCFGLFASTQDAAQSSSEIAASNPNWWVRVSGIS